MLLHIEPVKMAPTTQDGKTKLPLYLEVFLKSDEGPYLVTSSTGLLWREKPLVSEPRMLRTALREVSPASLFTSILEAIITFSDKSGLGIVTPTVREADARMAKHGMGACDTLDRVKAPWLPHGVSYVLVPVDREQLGTVFIFEGTSRVAAVMQGVSRAISIVRL